MMKFQPNINEINLHFFFKKRKYSTCSVYTFFINDPSLLKYQDFLQRHIEYL